MFFGLGICSEIVAPLALLSLFNRRFGPSGSATWRTCERAEATEGVEAEPAPPFGEHRASSGAAGLPAAGQADAGALLRGAHPARLLRDRLPGAGVVCRVALPAHGRSALPDAGEALDEGDGGP